MPTSKTPSRPILTKVYEDDALMLDKIAALGLLQGWKGDWNSRAAVVSHLVVAYSKKLPEPLRDMLGAT